MQKQNPLQKLESYGQSIWLDFLSTGMLTSGQLKRLLDDDGLGGVTTGWMARMALSVWKCHPTWRMIPQVRSPKPAASGPRSTGPMCSSRFPGRAKGYPPSSS